MFRAAIRSVAGAVANDDQKEIERIAGSIPRMSKRELISLEEDRNLTRSGLAFYTINKRDLSNLRATKDNMNDTIMKLGAESLYRHRNLSEKPFSLTGHYNSASTVKGDGLFNQFDNYECAITIEKREELFLNRWAIKNRRNIGHWKAKVASIFPPAILRTLLYKLYCPDVSLTLLPMPPRLTSGGSPIEKIYGIPPLAGKLPIMLCAVSGTGRLFFSVLTGLETELGDRSITGEFGKQLARNGILAGQDHDIVSG
jgi:hypothetical protein